MRSPGLRHPARLAGASLLRLQSDERLAELASSGHESAFDAIVDRYRTPLLRYCAGIVGPSRAEDAVQQALINAHDALQRTDDVRNLRSWLYRIAHNASLNVLRAVRDDVPLDEYELAASRGSAGAGAGAVAAGPAESFERSERFRSTLAALQALPERQRAALVLRELEGRSHEEIAAALGVTKGSARQHLMRARVAVRTAVTAVTPYPLVVRLAEWASASAAGSGWVDAAATAGAGASLAKLTAGLAATGALVGGAAVGTEHVVHGGSDAGVSAGAAELPRAAERSAERVVKRASEVVVAMPAAAAPTSGPRTSERTKRSSSAPRRERRSAPRDGDGGGGAKAEAPISSPAAPVAPATSHRGRDRSDSQGDDDHSERDSHRGRKADPDGAQGHGRREKDDKPGASRHAKKDERSPSSAPATSHRGDEDDDAGKGGGGSSESSGRRSGSGSGSSGSDRGSGSGSGSGLTTTTDSSSGSGTSSGTTTAGSPPTTTTTTSSVDADDEG